MGAEEMARHVARFRRLLATTLLVMAAGFAAFASGASASPGAYKVLLVSALEGCTGGASTFAAQLAAQPGIATVDTFDGSTGTPTDLQLDQYDMVVTVSDCGAFHDPTAIGNNLADYADQGGVVVEYAYGMDSGSPYGIEGRWLSGGYSPYVPGGVPNDSVTLGTYDAASPLMAGVSSLTARDDTNATLAPGATRVALWNNGLEAVAYKGQAAAVNASVENEAPWSGDYARLTLNAVTWLGRRTLTVAKSGTGSGTVTSSPGGISCGGACSANYNKGSTVTLTASASSGSTFTGWSGACSGTSTCTVTMNAAQSVTATFAALPHGTTLSKSTINKKKHKATFKFLASGTITGFQCALARSKGKHHKAGKLVFRACLSPKTYKHLKHGRYTFEVRAVNATGPDPTPAIKKFKI